MTAFLEERKIATRLVFAGNLTRQPAYADIPCRKIGALEHTDFVMSQLFWIGVYPGITSAMAGYVVETLHAMPRSAAGVAV